MRYWNNSGRLVSVEILDVNDYREMHELVKKYIIIRGSCGVDNFLSPWTGNSSSKKKS